MRPVSLVCSLVFVLSGALARAQDSPPPLMPAGTKEPQVAVAPDGRVLVVAAKGDEISCASSPDGSAFTKPVLVARAPGLMLGMRRGPRIAATASSLVVTAIAKMSAGDRTAELLSWRSKDNGASWEGPRKLNGAAGSAIEGLQGLAAGPDDRFACVWLDQRGAGMEVYVATSTDGGSTWAETVAYRSPDGHVCECCHPSVAWSARGDLIVMWRNWLGGSRDLWLARSKDGGKTFPEPQKLGRGTWPLRACPMDGGGVAVRPDGEVGTIWRRKTEVFFAAPGAEERLLAEGAQGQIASGPGGFYMVWQEKQGGDVLCSGPGGRGTEKIGTKAGNPSIAGALTGEGPVVASWATEAGVVARMVSKRRE